MSTEIHMDSTLDLTQARITLVSALAWRAIAEFARRHNPTHAIRLEQIHPGMSVRGVIVLHLMDTRRGVSQAVYFNLGGQSGTWSTGDRWPEAQGSLATLLTPAPATELGEIELALGWKMYRASITPSTPQVMALRLMATLLEHAVFSVTPWRVTLGLVGGQEPVVPDWVRVFGVSDASDDPHALQDLALLHRAHDDSPALSREQAGATALAMRLSTGEIMLLGRDSVTPIGTAEGVHAVFGRDLRLAAAHLMHMLLR